jgi:hypothetical protein
LTDQIDRVLRKGLAKKPEDRYPNCSNFVGALELACAESRGWKTLPAGTSQSLPTLAVDHARDLTAPPPAAFASSTSERRPDSDEPRRRSWLLPLFMSILVVAGVAAVFIYESGLGGQAARPETTQQPVAESQAPPDAARPPENKPEDTRPEDTKPADAKPADEPAAQPASQPPTDTAPAQDTAPEPLTRPAPQKPKPLPPPAEEAPRPRIAPAPRAARALSGRLQDIWVTSNPPGAKAVLDNNLATACSTPCMLHGAAGLHHLTLSQAGYINENRDVTVGDIAVDLPQIAMEQPRGTLFLTTNPPGAAIWINGQLNPKATPAELTLTPGSYSIRVERNGVSKTETVQVRDGLLRLSIPLIQ